MFIVFVVVFFQAEDGIRDLVRSRGLGDVYKRQLDDASLAQVDEWSSLPTGYPLLVRLSDGTTREIGRCLLYTSDAADERSSVDLGGRRIIKKKSYAGSVCRISSLYSTKPATTDHTDIANERQVLRKHGSTRKGS